jgi:hypothetical protein
MIVGVLKEIKTEENRVCMRDLATERAYGFCREKCWQGERV